MRKYLQPGRKKALRSCGGCRGVGYRIFRGKRSMCPCRTLITS